jgi:hypothetical protein
MPREYVMVPSSSIINRLLEEGFYQEKIGNELKFIRKFKENKRVAVVVYSSISEGENVAREKGTDAIRVLVRGVVGRIASSQYRVCTLNAQFPIVKRMGTVDGVLARLDNRIQEADFWIDERIARSFCECGSTRWRNSLNCIGENGNYNFNK